MLPIHVAADQQTKKMQSALRLQVQRRKMMVDPKWDALTHEWHAKIVCLEWELLSGPESFIARVKADPRAHTPPRSVR